MNYIQDFNDNVEIRNLNNKKFITMMRFNIPCVHFNHIEYNITNLRGYNIQHWNRYLVSTYFDDRRYTPILMTDIYDNNSFAINAFINNNNNNEFIFNHPCDLITDVFFEMFNTWKNVKVNLICDSYSESLKLSLIEFDNRIVIKEFWNQTTLLNIPKIRNFKIQIFGKNIPKKIFFTAIFLSTKNYNNLRLTNNINIFDNVAELYNDK